MKKKVFIDGSAGTTGLRIWERLSSRQDIELVRLHDELRKDPAARADAINSSDIVFLCLPDDAARESAGLVKNNKVVIIDTSTAHRVSDGWIYGFPEIGGRKEVIPSSTRIANPGCHASGFIALVAPLRQAGVIAPDVQLSCFSLTGYSGGGKKMIAEYEAYGYGAKFPGESRSDGSEDPGTDRPFMAQLLSAPRMYGLTQAHKHLPEMAKVCELDNPPIFCPIVAPYYAGMEVTVPLSRHDISVTKEEIARIYADYYKEGMVHFAPAADESGFVSAAAFAGRDDMQVSVFGNDERILLVSRFDNLGKGASGAAIQNMNLVLGCREDEGLVCGSRDMYQA